MRCGQCGALVGEGYRFCEDCGAPVGVCPACGEPATPGYGLTEVEFISCYRGWLAALRGDAATAETLLAALRNLRASEDTQDKALISTAAAFTAAARRQPAQALRHRQPAGLPAAARPRRCSRPRPRRCPPPRHAPGRGLMSPNVGRVA